MKVLVVNAGSSSLKYQLFDTETKAVLAKGICERIGIDGNIEHRKGEGGEKITKEIPMKDHAVATQILVDYLTDKETGVIETMDEIEAVGHRIVSGGPYFFESTLINDEVLEKLKKCVPFAPLHTPPHLMGISGCLEVMPKVPQVLVFDTAFHTTIPKKASTFPISKEMREKYSIRRYGAHGTSHRFVANEMIKILQKTRGMKREDTKIVTCHIGNGASISAVKGGVCVDTSMGFTPLDGIMMGTRCGAIDPAIVTFIMKNEGFDPDRMDKYMNQECGFLGVTGGFSSDSRNLERAIAENDPDHKEDAVLATSIMAYQVQKFIGAYTAAMNGLDAVVFTAGMGEHNPELRDRACANMQYFGIEIDRKLNAVTHHQPNTVRLSTDNSHVEVYVIPTDEEYMIASETEDIVSKL